MPDASRSLPELETLTVEQIHLLFPGATEAGYSTKEMRALLYVVDTVAQAICEMTHMSGGIPSGHLYSFMMSIMSLDTYNSILGLLKKAGLVAEHGHFLTWVAK